MTLEDSTVQLWLLGLVWTLGPWLALGFAAVLATLLIRQVSRMARGIETNPVREGTRGFLGVVRDRWIHGALTESSLYIVVVCIMLAGSVAAAIQGFVRRSLEETMRDVVQEDFVVPPAPIPVSGGEGLLDLVILAGLMMALVSITLGIGAYRRLRHHAAEVAAQLPADDSPRPLAVRLFHDNKAIGIVVLVVGCWMLWGLLTQIAGMAIYLSPAAQTVHSIPGVETAAIVFLLILGLVMFGVMFAPLAWLSVRHVRLQIRHLRENRIAWRLFYANVAVWCGLLGSLLNLYLIEVLGNSLWPDVFAR